MSHGRDGSMAGGSELRSSAKWQLRCANERTERGKQHRSSQRVQWWPRRARGGTGADEFDEDGRRVRGRRRRRWRRCGTSGASWLVEEVEGGPAELPGASVSRGVAGSHGGSRRWRRLRSVAGGETEERGGGRSRERGRSERGSGLRGVAGGTREGGGSQAGRRWPPRPRACEHAAAPTGKRKTTGGGVAVAGWADWAGSGGLHG